jgi:hypothetical protein
MELISQYMGNQLKGSLRQAWLYRFHVTRTNLALGLLAKSYIILTGIWLLSRGIPLGPLSGHYSVEFARGISFRSLSCGIPPWSCDISARVTSLSGSAFGHFTPVNL